MMLVTGAAGFLGRAIATGLGPQAITLSRGPASKHGDGLHITADLTHPNAAQTVLSQLQGREVSGIIHAAAVTPWSQEPDFSQDIVMAQAIVEIAKALQVRYVYFLSGWNVYDPQAAVPLSEDAAIRPTTPYGQSKADVEAYLSKNLGDTKLVNLRLASVYGPGQTSAGLLTNLVHAALTEKSLSIGAKQTRRDYLYVGDLVAALSELVTYTDLPSQNLNLGSGSSVSVQEVAETIASLYKARAGTDISLQYDEPLHEAAQLDNVLAIGRAQRLGLLQQNTPFSDGLAAYIDWRIHENIL